MSLIKAFCRKHDISLSVPGKGFVEQSTSEPRVAKFALPFFSFYLQVGECQKEGSSSGKQGSQGRGDLWVRSQGDQKGRERGRGRPRGENKVEWNGNAENKKRGRGRKRPADF